MFPPHIDHHHHHNRKLQSRVEDWATISRRSLNHLPVEHHRQHRLVEPEVERRGERRLEERGDEALVEGGDALLLQRGGDAVEEALVDGDGAEGAAAGRLEAANLQALADQVQRVDEELGDHARAGATEEGGLQGEKRRGSFDLETEKVRKGKPSAEIEIEPESAAPERRDPRVGGNRNRSPSLPESESAGRRR